MERKGGTWEVMRSEREWSRCWSLSQASEPTTGTCCTARTFRMMSTSFPPLLPLLSSSSSSSSSIVPTWPPLLSISPSLPSPLPPPISFFASLPLYTLPSFLPENFSFLQCFGSTRGLALKVFCEMLPHAPEKVNFSLRFFHGWFVYLSRNNNDNMERETHPMHLWLGLPLLLFLSYWVMCFQWSPWFGGEVVEFLIACWVLMIEFWCFRNMLCTNCNFFLFWFVWGREDVEWWRMWIEGAKEGWDPQNLLCAYNYLTKGDCQCFVYFIFIYFTGSCDIIM